MQKTIKYGAVTATLLLVAHVAMAQVSPAVQDSLLTVDQLLKADNALAREAAKKSSPGTASSSVQSIAPGSEKIRPMDGSRFAVNRISGVAGAYVVTVTGNGVRQDGMTIGSSIASCKITAIFGRCVSFEPVSKKGKTDKDAAPSCPNLVCWSGEQQVPVQAPGGGVIPGQPSPMPMPTGGMPVRR